VQLAQPLIARLGATQVILIDVSVFGARIEHHVPLTTGSWTRLVFHWGDEEIAVDAQIVRSRLERFSTGADGLTIYHSGIAFGEIPKETRTRLKDMLALFISRALEEQKLNARGVVPEHHPDNMPIFRGGQLTMNADQTESMGDARLPISRLAKSSGYVCFTLERGRWRSKRTLDPAQPAEGFTISASEEASQAEQLCEAYLKSDAEGRRIIRLFAQLSIMEGGGIPPGRFEP
jgi:hypothetical protein